MKAGLREFVTRPGFFARCRPAWASSVVFDVRLASQETAIGRSRCYNRPAQNPTLRKLNTMFIVRSER